MRNCSKWKAYNVTKWGPGSLGGEEKEADRWNVLFNSFIYWLSQFGAEASSRAGNDSGEETVTAGWYNGISAVSEVQQIHLTGKAAGPTSTAASPTIMEDIESCTQRGLLTLTSPTYTWADCPHSIQMVLNLGKAALWDDYTWHGINDLFTGLDSHLCQRKNTSKADPDQIKW